MHISDSFTDQFKGLGLIEEVQSLLSGIDTLKIKIYSVKDVVISNTTLYDIVLLELLFYS